MDLQELESALIAKPTAENVEKLVETARTAVAPQVGKHRSPAPDETAVGAIHAVRRVIVGWLSNGTLEASVAASSEKSGTFPSKDKKRKQQAVLEAPHDSSAVAKSLYYQLLGLLLSGIDAGALSVRLLCLRSLLECVKSSRLVGSGQFDAELLTRIVTKMVVAAHGVDAKLVDAFVEEFADEYDDVRFYLLRSLCTVAKRKLVSSPDAVSKDEETKALITLDAKSVSCRLVKFLLQIGVPTSETDLSGKIFAIHLQGLKGGAPKPGKRSKPGSGQVTEDAKHFASVHWQRRSFSEAWLTVLRLPLDLDTYHEVLRNCAQEILPYMVNPIMFCDFLTDSFNVGGLVSLLALDGIWELMRNHQLDYPDFYPKLYSLLTLETLHADHREAFFKRLDMFLSSSFLASYIAAAFAKRMARLMIRSEVPVLLFGIPFVFNILKQHPALTKMVHRSDGGRLRWTVPFRKRAGTAADYAEENARTVKEYEAAEGDAVFGEDDGASEGEVETVPVVEDRKEKAKPKAKAAATRTPAPNPDGEDVFDEVTNDPAACRAIETCLWEITALSSHWNPSIAAQSAAFSTKWVSQRKQVDRCAEATYSSMLESELKRTRSVKRDHDSGPARVTGGDDL